MDPTRHLSRSYELSGKVARVLQKRVELANRQFSERAKKAVSEALTDARARPATPWDLALSWYEYSVDFAQRSVLFWDTLRQRGNQYLELVQQGQPPVLRFQYETVVDGRTLDRPVNYALVRIVPPPGTGASSASRGAAWRSASRSSMLQCLTRSQAASSVV